MIQLLLKILLFSSLFLQLVYSSHNCRFSKYYDFQELSKNQIKINEFIKETMFWEGQFHKIAYNNFTGITFDGTEINYTTGLPTQPLHFWTAASKESLHMMMLTLAINGNEYAKIFIDPENPENGEVEALKLLEKKISSLESWNSKYPGFGGYLPWVSSKDSGMIPRPDWKNKVPALDNGEMIWSLYSAQIATSNRNDSRSKNLSIRLKKYLQILSSSARNIFYNGDGFIRSVATIKDNQILPLSPDNYGLDCANPAGNCFLDDPYEGELFIVFMDLYSNWTNEKERDLIWINKRAKLQSVEFDTPSGPITVQRGWWFSSHEQWKYLELPYLSSSPINRKVFFNGEKARTINSAINHIPGLYASVTDVSQPEKIPSNYISAAGIQSISFQPVVYKNVITPYGAYPIMLADLGIGLGWYNHMLKGSKMQGPLGSTEGISINGTFISPVVTWDSKITNVVSMLGGVGEIVKQGLIRDQKLERFSNVIDKEWNLAFPEMNGENIPFYGPTMDIPTKNLDFLNCN